MKQLLRIGILSIIVGVLLYLSGGIKPATVRAFGDLVVDFHVPSSTPLFFITNMAPGNVQTKPVDVTNNGSLPHIVAVKGVRTGGSGITPLIEGVLTIVITDGITPVYGTGSATGAKTLQNFFTDSASVNGIVLNTIAPLGHKTYALTVTFPSSAGNEYQAKSVIFDLTFGSADVRNVVINEVYYKVDSNHGLDSPKDRGATKGDKQGINDEWVELYNPTDHDISLKDWTITDNSGNASIIHPNKIIKTGGFALLSKDSATWKYWNRKTGAEVIELGNQIGDGLDNNADHLILTDNNGNEVDRMSWGTDTSGFNPAAINPLVPLGSSTERVSPGFDTDKASDWQTRTPPTPGS